VKLIPYGPTKRTQLKDLMKSPCQSTDGMDVHSFKDFGRAAIKKQTYTEAHFAGGKYYANVAEYDKECTCPILYRAEWETWHVNNKVTTPEIREGSAIVETTKITAYLRRNYLLFYDDTYHVAEHDTGEPQFNDPKSCAGIGGF